MDITIIFPEGYSGFAKDGANNDYVNNVSLKDYEAMHGHSARAWNWRDPISESVAGIVNQFGSNLYGGNSNIDRLQSLIGDDEHWRKMVENGIATEADRLAFQYDTSGQYPAFTRASADVRNQKIKSYIDSLKGTKKSVDNVVNNIAPPTPHAEPEGFLQNTADFLLRAAPNIGLGLAEYLTLGPAGTIGLNTILGNTAANEQVYSNLRQQGKSVPEALAGKESLGWNLTDLLIRGGTSALTMGALSKAVNPYNWDTSPIMQTLGNIARGSLYSGVGAASEQALTNYRGDVDNSLGDLAKTGAGSAATTGLMGLAMAATNWRNLINAQRFWKAKRPIDVEYSFRDVPPDDTPPQLRDGNTPPNQPSSPGSETLALPDKAMLDQLHRYNDSITRMGFTPVNENFRFADSFLQIEHAIKNGQISLRDAHTMLTNAGFEPKTVNSMLNSIAGFNAGEFFDNHGYRRVPVNNGLTRPEININDALANPDLRDSVPVHSAAPGILDAASRNIVNRVPLDNMHVGTNDGLSNIPKGEVVVKKEDITRPEVNTRGFDKRLIDRIITRPQVNQLDTNNPLLQPPAPKPASVMPNAHYVAQNRNRDFEIPEPTKQPEIVPEAPSNLIPMGQKANNTPAEQPKNTQGTMWRDPLSYRSKKEPEAPAQNVNNPAVIPPAVQTQEEEKKPKEPQSVNNTGKSDNRKALDSRIEQEVNTFNPVYTDNGSLSPRFKNPQEWFSHFSPYVQRNFINEFKNKGYNPDEAVSKLYEKYSGTDADSYDNYGITPVKQPEKSQIKHETEHEYNPDFDEDNSYNGLEDNSSPLQDIPEQHTPDNIPDDKTANLQRVRDAVKRRNSQLTPEQEAKLNHFLYSDEVTEELRNGYKPTAPAPEKPTSTTPYITPLGMTGETEHKAEPQRPKVDAQKIFDDLMRIKNSRDVASNFYSIINKMSEQERKEVLSEFAKRAGLPRSDDWKILEWLSNKHLMKQITGSATIEPDKRLPKREREGEIIGSVTFGEKGDKHTISAEISYVPNHIEPSAIFSGRHIRFKDETGAVIAGYFPHGEYKGKAFQVNPRLLKSTQDKLRKAIERNLPELLKVGGFTDENGDIIPDGNEDFRLAWDELSGEKPIEKRNNPSMPNWKKLKNGTIDISGMTIHGEGYTRGTDWKPFFTRFRAVANSTKGTIRFFVEGNKSPDAEYNANTDTFTDLNRTSSEGKYYAQLIEKKFRENIKDFYSDSTKPEKEPPKEVTTHTEKTTQAEPEKSNHESGNTQSKFIFGFVGTPEKEKEIQNSDYLDRFKEGFVKAAGEHGLPVSQKETASEPVTKDDGTVDKVKASLAFADFIVQYLDSGDTSIKNTTDLNNKAAEFFGTTKATGEIDQKDIYDAMEMGINKWILKNRFNPSDSDDNSKHADFNAAVRHTLAKLDEAINRLPTQTNRTEKQIKLQQFSTPATLAYIVNWLANIQDGDIVLEPSAGLGGLAVFAKNSGATLILNEYDKEGRAKLLEAMNLGKVYTEDAKHIADILSSKLSESERPDKIIMNPPFSADVKLSAKNTHSAEAHIMQALQILKDGGRLVAILGRGMADNAKSFQQFWKHIKKHYNVRANIGLDGKLYYKNGTSFDNIIVVIDKTGPTPEGGTFTNQGELYSNLRVMLDNLKHIHDEAPRTGNKPVIETNITLAVEKLTDKINEIYQENPEREDYPTSYLETEDLKKYLQLTDSEFNTVMKILEDKGLYKRNEEYEKRFYFSIPNKAALKNVEKPTVTPTEQKTAESTQVSLPNGNFRVSRFVNDNNNKQYDTYHFSPDKESKNGEYRIMHTRGSGGFMPAGKYNPNTNKLYLADYIINGIHLSGQLERSKDYPERFIKAFMDFAAKNGVNIPEPEFVSNTEYKEQDKVTNNSTKSDEKVEQDKSKPEIKSIISDVEKKEYTTPSKSVEPKAKPTKNVNAMGAVAAEMVRLFDADPERNTYLLLDLKKPLYAMGLDNKAIDDVISQLWEDEIIAPNLNGYVDGGSTKVDNDLNLIEEENKTVFIDENDYKYKSFKIFSIDKLRELANRDVPAENKQPAPPQSDSTPTTDNSPKETGTNKQPEAREVQSEIKVTKKTDKQKADERAKTNKDEIITDDGEMSVNSVYHPSISGFAEHPTELIESTAMSSVAFPKISHTPNLPSDIQEKGLLSNAQMETVIYAGQSFQHMNKDGTRRGFFIGDGTGVGKGREIAAIIMDTLRSGHGNGKAVWLSEKYSLLKDARRDYEALGNNPEDIFSWSGFSPNDKIADSHNKGILLGAYSTMNNTPAKKGRKQSRMGQLEEWLGKDFDGIIVLDEAHNVNHVMANDNKKGRKTNNTSARAINTRDFIRKFPKARVLYVSATGATEVENLAMLERLGLWGEGTQFNSARDFANAIAAGRTAGMELMARDLKSMGLYTSRSLSMRGVTYRTVQHDLTDYETAIYNKLCDQWQIVFQNIDKAIDLCGGESRGGLQSAKSQFFGYQQRFYNQIITILQTPAIIGDIEKQLDAGNSAVIQIQNTYEAATDRAKSDLEKEAAQQGREVDYDDLDVSPIEMLVDFLQTCFPVQKMEEVEDENGNKTTRPVTDSEGNPILSAEAVRLRDNLIAEVREIREFSETPIDIILNHFGHNAVAEITGRSKRVRKNTDGKKVFETNRTDAIRAKEVQEFNEGKRRILIFSDKGGTGASYHADKNFKNHQKRVHYLLQAGWRADKAIQGLGRSHRSNEAEPPEYVLVTTDIPGQKRFISTIARRIEQMGALNRGERKAAGQGVFSADDNLEADYVRYALDTLLDDIDKGLHEDINPRDLFSQLGFKKDDSTQKIICNGVTQFLNRILIMRLGEQKRLFEYFMEEVFKRKQELLEAGKLDTRPEDLRALNIKMLDDMLIYHDEEYGTDTRYVQLEVTNPQKPRTIQSVLEAAKKKGKDPKNIFYQTSEGDIVAAIYYNGYSTQKLGKRNVTAFEEGYHLLFVNPRRRKDVSANELKNDKYLQQITYTHLDFDEAQRIWQEQSEQLPKTYTEVKHMLTGALLPVWTRINDDNFKIQRVHTDDGHSFLGRLISPSKIKSTLLGLGYSPEIKKYTAESLIEALKTPGTEARLSMQAKMKLSLVNGEKRLEIYNTNFAIRNQLDGLGVIKEIIAGKERYFFPSGNNTLLEKWLTMFPVTEVSTPRDVMAEAAEKINSEIDAVNSDYNLNIIHPSWRKFLKLGASPVEANDNPDENPYVQSSPYAFKEPETEQRYQESKTPKEEQHKIWKGVKSTFDTIRKGFSDYPELAGDDNMLYAQEQFRALNREMRADSEETVRMLQAALIDLKNPDDYDLFSRAVELMDLKETRELDPEAALPFGYRSTESLLDDYNRIMEFVEKNPRVKDAIEKFEVLNDNIRNELIEAAEMLDMYYYYRDKLNRKHYFRHIVLDYFNITRGGKKPRPTMRNPEKRGYMEDRKGTEKDILSEFITAMGEVWGRMNGDIKIMKRLAKLRKHYDIIEDLKQQAFKMNYDSALQKMLEDLEDMEGYVDLSENRLDKAKKELDKALLHRQAQAIKKLFKLAQDGNLPAGDNNEWSEFITKFAEAGQLEKLDDDMRQKLTRYVGWLAGIPEKKNKAANAAKKFLRGYKGKMQAMKKILGADYVDWKNLIPDDYDIWSPFDTRLIFSANTINETAIIIAQEYLDELLGIPLKELGDAIASGATKQFWCIPQKLAATLNKFGVKQPQGKFGQIMRKIMNGFKGYVLMNPFKGRVLLYNLRNFFGDLEAVLQGNPAALKYFKQAYQELYKVQIKGGVPTGMLAEFIKRGGGLTTELSTELKNWKNLPEFEQLYEPEKRSLNPLKYLWDGLKAYVKVAGTITNYRESILRYAAFLAYYNQIMGNDGKPLWYGMSKPKEVDTLKDSAYDMAFKLANENLGAYDEISQNTQWLRDNSVSTFISWLEVNFTRSMQMYKNIWTGNSYLEYWIKKHGQKFIDKFIRSGGGGNGNGNEPPKNNNGGEFDDSNNDGWNWIVKKLRKSPLFIMRFGITLAMAAPLMLMIRLWNHLLGMKQKDMPGLSLFNNLALYNGRKDLYYFSRLAASMDFFNSIGMGTIANDLAALFDGKITFAELASNIVSGPTQKFIDNLNPIAKMGIELFAGRSSFPDFRDSNQIRDKARYFFQSFGLEWYYDWLTGKPHEKFFPSPSSFMNVQKKEEASYWYILSKKRDFQEKELGVYVDGYTKTKRSEAFYYARRAAAIGDYTRMRKYMMEYFRESFIAGNDPQKGIESSIKAMKPLQGLSDEQKIQFLRWLSKDDRKIYYNAVKFYQRLSSKFGVVDTDIF